MRKRFLFLFFLIFAFGVAFSFLSHNISPSGDDLVYVFENRGSNYHLKGHFSLDHMISMSLSTAVAQGYSPCSQCVPADYPAPSPSRSAPAAAPSTVYVTAYGTRYHRPDCAYLAQSRIELTLEQARAGGYTPCTYCNPPQ